MDKEMYEALREKLTTADDLLSKMKHLELVKEHIPSKRIVFHTKETFIEVGELRVTPRFLSRLNLVLQELIDEEYNLLKDEYERL